MRFGTLILIGVILVKTGYTLDEIGAYELFFFLANLVSFFWTMGLKNTLLSFYPRLEEGKRKSLFFNLGILLASLGVVSGFGLLILEPLIARGLGIEGVLSHFWLIFLYMILSAPGNFTEYFYLLLDRSKSIMIYGSVIYSLQFLFIAVGVYLGFSIQSLLMLMVVWAAIKFIWFWYTTFTEGEAHFDWPMISTFLLLGFPLIVQMLVGNGMEYVDGFLVNQFFDEATFAQFRYGARELPLATVLIGAISTAMIPLAVSNMGETLIKVKSKIKRMMLILFPLSMVLMLISPFAFPFFYSEEFTVSSRIFNVYLLIIGSRILMPQVVLFARQNNVLLMLSGFVELILNVTLSIIFLKRYGVVGIAWATVIAYLVNKIFLAVYARYKHGVKLSEYLDVKLYGFSFVLLILTYYISTLYN
jgi:O-antigen/teichoic acid export membrane protein